MSAERVSYPDPKTLDDFAKATGLRLALVIRDIVRIAEIFNLLDEEFLGAQAVLTGGMALRLFASTRVSIRDFDVSVVGKGSALTIEELERLLEYEDPQVTIAPSQPGGWTRRDLYQAKPLIFEQRFNPVVLADNDSWISADVSLRGLELKPVPMNFIHGYPFTLGVEDEWVDVMDPRSPRSSPPGYAQVSSPARRVPSETCAAVAASGAQRDGERAGVRLVLAARSHDLGERGGRALHGLVDRVGVDVVESDEVRAHARPRYALPPRHRAEGST